MTEPTTPVLDAQNVSKTFGAVIALRDASLRLNAGEVVALIGANGAGKSTFVKILTGALRPDGGSFRIRGRDANVTSPAAARKSGLIPVYQEPSLIPDLDVADNLRLTNTPQEPFRHWVGELGIPDLRLDDMISQLPLATLRILDLARALAMGPDVLLLDEMTAALPPNLVERVLKVVRQQADAGRAVIFISHRFSEIAELCDRASVLRDGATVGNLPISEGVEERIVELMLGAGHGPGQAAARGVRSEVRTDTPRLRAKNLGAGTKLTDVSFDLHQGEVLGVVALEGQGQDELFDVLAGNRRAASGSVEIDGRAHDFRHPADAIAAGLSFVPGDRAHALLMSRSVRENIALPLVARFANWGVVPKKDEDARVAAAIARWIATGVETLLLFDATRGIDIRTKRQIYALVRDLALQGAAVLYYTSELAEVRLACDRVVVFFGGRVVGVIDAALADEPTLLRMAYGLTEAAEA